MASEKPQAVRLTDRYVETFKLAPELHGSAPRKGTTIPYVTHVMSVSALVLDNGGDEDRAIAGLLHDAMEDSEDGERMLVLIRGKFGTRVASIVEACSDTVGAPNTDKPPFHRRKEMYPEKLVSADDDARLVSACDKLRNARAIVSDLRQIGNELWQRFGTRSAADQLWYYQSLCDVFAGRVDSSLASTLRDVVVDMTILASALGSIPQERRDWLSHSTDHRTWLLSRGENQRRSPVGADEPYPGFHPTLAADGVRHLVLWNPRVDIDGITRWPHHKEAGLFAMHHHLIDIHGLPPFEPPFEEGEMSAEQMVIQHTAVHGTPAGHLHDEAITLPTEP